MHIFDTRTISHLLMVSFYALSLTLLPSKVEAFDRHCYEELECQPECQTECLDGKKILIGSAIVAGGVAALISSQVRHHGREGRKGATGSPGDTGPIGPTGATAVDFPVEVGYSLIFYPSQAAGPAEIEINATVVAEGDIIRATPFVAAPDGDMFLGTPTEFVFNPPDLTASALIEPVTVPQGEVVEGNYLYGIHFEAVTLDSFPFILTLALPDRSPTVEVLRDGNVIETVDIPRFENVGVLNVEVSGDDAQVYTHFGFATEFFD